jgi:thiamine kinase-like enzyme
MLLSEYNIAHYLMDKGYILPENIVEGKYSARRQDSRNNNFLINKEYDNAFFIKQCRGTQALDMETMRIEATIYWLANNDQNFKKLKAFLPKYFDYNYQQHILVTELLSKSINLHQYLDSSNDFSATIGTQIATLLAAYHQRSISPDEFNQAPFTLFKKNKPWVFNLTSMDFNTWATSVTGPQQHSINLIRTTPQFVELLQAQESLWQASTLCHNDIKFPNLLIEENEEGLHLRLIDWELADIGDPAWDIAAVFNSFFTFWISRQEKQQGKEAINMEKMQPTIHAFWNKYCAVMHIENQGAFLRKCLSFSALKLVHTCFESTIHAQRLQAHSAQMLQLSYNILKSPEEAAQSLMALNLT